MKPKTPTPPKQTKPTASKPKLSFSVDRSEFDISSEWVQAVMRPPSLPEREAPFFSPPINNATEASSTTDAHNPAVVESASVTNDAPVVETAPVAQNTAGEIVESASVADNLPEAIDPTVANIATGQSITATVGHDSPGGLTTPVADIATHRVAESATVANRSSRPGRLRPLKRITDGLTPGQYAVYSLMLSNSDTEEGGERLYRGGYADIGRLTGLSKRGIQNVIGELQEKAVIRLHTHPGHRRSQTSAYIVPGAESVLAAWFERGWRFATGKSKKLTNGAPVALFTTGDAA